MTSTSPPPPPAGSGAADGFFDSLRRLNIPRSQERWIGGVAGGIAARLGVDPLIVRGVFLVITIFGGFGLLVYGLGWALLPEASDRRIHLQEAIRGRFDAALVGAAVFAVIGLSRVGFWWDGWVGVPFMIGMIALVVLAVVVIAAIRNSGSSTPPGGGTSAPPGGGSPPPTAPPTSGGSVPFTTAPPTSGGSVPFMTAPPTSSRTAAFPPGSGHQAAAQIAPGENAEPAEPTAVIEPGRDEPPAGERAPDAADEQPAGEQTDAEPTAAGYQAAGATPTVAYPTTTGDTAAGTDAAASTGEPVDQTPTAAGHSAWTGDSAWASGDQPAWSTGDGTAGPTPPPQPPTTAPPPPPSKPPRRGRPGPGKLLVRAAFGLALLVIAGLVLGAEYYASPSGDWQGSSWLVALGAGLVVLGLGAALAGILGRRSGSLGVIGTLLAIVLVPWAISTPLLTQYNFADSENYGERYWSPQTAEEAANGYNLAAGRIQVDLSDLAAEQITTPIDIELGAGDVELVVPDGMPVTVTSSVQGETTAVNLSGWSAEVNGEARDLGNRTELGWRFDTITELTSPEAEDTTPITVNLEVGFGAIEVRELP